MMKCCGQARAALSGANDHASPTPPASATDRPAAAVAASPPQSGYGTGVLRYKDDGPILVHGPRTGRPYRFSGTEPVQMVDRQDFEVLLSTGLFQRA